VDRTATKQIDFSRLGMNGERGRRCVRVQFRYFASGTVAWHRTGISISVWDVCVCIKRKYICMHIPTHRA